MIALPFVPLADCPRNDDTASVAAGAVNTVVGLLWAPGEAVVRALELAKWGRQLRSGAPPRAG